MILFYHRRPDLSFIYRKTFTGSRQVLQSVRLTGKLEDYAPVIDLPDDYEFFKYQDALIKSVQDVPSHDVIKEYITKMGEDYRFQVEPHPIEELRCRTIDNTTISRTKQG